MRAASLEDLLESLVPGQRQAKAAGKCPFCGEVRGVFRDELSAREANISGLCQACQDKVFKEEEPEP